MVLVEKKEKGKGSWMNGPEEGLNTLGEVLSASEIEWIVSHGYWFEDRDLKAVIFNTIMTHMS